MTRRGQPLNYAQRDFVVFDAAQEHIAFLDPVAQAMGF
jgi:hypothetical protein